MSDCGGDCGGCDRCQAREAEYEHDYWLKVDAERQEAAYEAERAVFDADPLTYLADPTAQPDEPDVPF